jgi:hypothetical protein
MNSVAIKRTNLENWVMNQPWPKGEGVNLSPQTKALRIKALMTALEHRRPLAVLDEFRTFIDGDGSGGTLTSSSHLALLLPLVENYLDQEIKAMRFHSLSVIFDGASDDGERVLVLVHGVYEDNPKALGYEAHG